MLLHDSEGLASTSEELLQTGKLTQTLGRKRDLEALPLHGFVQSLLGDRDREDLE
jgi:hypothetical protein